MNDYSHLTTPELNQLIYELSRDSRLKYDTRPEMMVWDESDYVEIDDATGEVTVDPDPLAELVRESKALGLYTHQDPFRGLC